MGKINNNYWVKSGFFAISQRLSIPIFGVGTFLILIRSLSKEEMGAWVLFLNITTVVEVARNGLLKAALVKYFTEATISNKSEVLASSFLINSTFTLLSLALILIGSQYMSGYFELPELNHMFFLYSLTALLFIPFTHLEYVQQANLNFKGIFYSYFVKQGWFFLAILILVLLLNKNLSLADLVLLQAFGVFCGAISSYLTAKKYLRHTMNWSSHWLNKIWHFGKYGLFTNLSNSGLTTTDHILIGGILSASSVAIHNAASRITNVFVIPSVAIADILYPKAVKANEDNGTNEVKNLYQKAVGATLVPMVPVILLIQFFPELIIRLLAGEAYLTAVPILRITILGIILLPFLKQFGTVMNTINKPNYNFYFVLILAVTNIAINFLFISRYGLIGGAMATLLSYLIGFIASQIILKRLVDISVIAVLKETIKYYLQIIRLITNKITSQ